jgi:hypothetical protein
LLLGGAAEGGMLTSGGRDYGDAFVLRCARTHRTHAYSFAHIMLRIELQSIAPRSARHGSESPLKNVNIRFSLSEKM